MYHKNQLALTDGNSMSLRTTTILRRASKQSDGTAANSAQAQPVSPSEPSEPADAHRQSAAETQARRQQSQPRSASTSPVPEIDEVAAEINSAMAELRRRAYENAPRCGGRHAHLVQEWLSVTEAACTFRLSKRVLSAWIKEGLVASFKGQSVNSHRLVHIDSILVYLQQQLQISKEASLRVPQNAEDMPASSDEERESDAVIEDDPMRGERAAAGASWRVHVSDVLSPIIEP